MAVKASSHTDTVNEKKKKKQTKKQRVHMYNKLSMPNSLCAANVDSKTLTTLIRRWLRSRMKCDKAGFCTPKLLKLFTCVPSNRQQEQSKTPQGQRQSHKTQEYGQSHINSQKTKVSTK
jgi:hypothetical protein